MQVYTWQRMYRLAFKILLRLALLGKMVCWMIEEITLTTSFKSLISFTFSWSKQINKGDVEYLYITSTISNQKFMLDKLLSFSSGLYFTKTKMAKSNYVSQKCQDPKTFILWHDRLGHPGSNMMRGINENTHGHPLKIKKSFYLMNIFVLCVLK